MNAISGNPSYLYNYYSTKTTSGRGTSSAGEGISAQDGISGLEEGGTVVEEQMGASSLSDKLNELISNGTITEDEKEELLSALEEVKKNATSPSPISPEVADSLDSLVATGTISEEQGDAVISTLENFGGSNPLQKLVDEGALTQNQMNTISSTFQNAVRVKHAQEAYGSAITGRIKRE
jgi:hypothetical protein